MPNSIISNIAAMNAQGNISAATSRAAASIARLSSGNAINKASDDVAGLATGTALRTQVTTLRTALANASQGSSLLQVADGALSQIVDILQRQKAIATQASSGQLTDTNRSLLNQEFQNLTSEIDRLATGTNFNGLSLLSGNLGVKTSLQRTDTLAAASTIAAPTLGGGTAVASAKAVQAFQVSTTTGAAALANGVAIGNLQVVTDSGGGTQLADAAFLAVDTSLYGQFSSFTFSGITYGAGAAGSATLNATINGVTYSGVVAGAATTAVLQNGNTYIKIGTGTLSFADSTAADNSRAVLANGFANTYIARENAVSGADFTGTVLAGATGAATAFVTARLANNGQFNVSNFQYVSNTGAANTNVLSVSINGTTFTSTAVKDSFANTGGSLQFMDATGLQTFTITTGAFTTTTGNMRTDLTARTQIIDALNRGLSKAGGNGVNFTIGSTSSDAINVSLGNASSTSIFNGAKLDVTTAATATAASNVLDNAITSVVSLRASVGALQSRFNFASNAIQSSIENQDAARAEFLDTDVSEESSKFASAQVQTQAGIAVLAQANQLPQSLLKLIQ